MIQLLLGIAMIIAVIGLINTLALSMIERTREVGLLRAVGMRRRQIMWMVTTESVVISVFGALLGIAVGIGLGIAVFQPLKEQGLTTLALPWQLMGIYRGRLGARRPRRRLHPGAERGPPERPARHRLRVAAAIVDLCTGVDLQHVHSPRSPAAVRLSAGVASRHGVRLSGCGRRGRRARRRPTGGRETLGWAVEPQDEAFIR